MSSTQRKKLTIIRYTKGEDPRADLKNMNIEKLRIWHGERNTLYHSELLGAFKEDCEQFLIDFARKESFTFLSFAAIWFKLQFHQILNGKDTHENLIGFFENCFFQLKKYIMFSQNLYIQVGAFYMLYSMYYIQKKSGLVKMKWTYEEYITVLKVKQNIQTCREFVYIFNKLLYEGAFLFVSEARRWGINPKRAHEERKLIDNIFCSDVDFTAVNAKIFSDEFYGMACIEKVEEEYQGALEEYLKEHPDLEDSFVTQAGDVTDDIIHDMENYLVITNLPETEITATPLPENTAISISSKRRQIKEKAFRMNNSKLRNSIVKTSE